MQLITLSLLIELCFEKHSRMKPKNVLKKYFYRDSDGEYVYTLANKKGVRVKRLAKVPTVSHLPIELWYNPFLYRGYITALSNERNIQNITGKYRDIWIRQNGHCFFCGAPILADQVKKIVDIDETKTFNSSNMAYVHSRCAEKRVEVFHTCEYFASQSDVTKLLEKLAGYETHTDKTNKFEKLKSYMWEQSRQTVTLKFKKIEEILGVKLPSNCVSLEWWRNKWIDNVTRAGEDTGYIIQSVSFDKKSVVFKRNERTAATVKIPDVFLRGKVPADAATELTVFLEYLRDKYSF